MMVKDPFAAFIVGPAAYTLWRTLQRSRNGEPFPLANLLLCAGIIVAVISPYYLHSDTVRFLAHRQMIEPSGRPWYSYQNLRLFTVGLCTDILSPPLFIAFVAGVYYSLSNTLDRGARTMILLWIGIPTAILIAMPHAKCARYFLPMLPAFAIVGGAGVARILSRRSGAAIISLLLAASVVQALPLRWRGFATAQYREIDYRRYVSGVMRSIDASIAGRLRAGAPAPAAQILVLFDDQFSNLSHYLDAYFWFQSYPVPLQERMLAFEGLRSLPAIAAYPRRLDFILFSITRDRIPPGGFSGNRLPFSLVEQLYVPWSDDAGAPAASLDGRVLKTYESAWNTIMDAQDSREVIYDNHTVSVYLYTIQRRDVQVENHEDL
jgi:4-amino-4-deoxy-L-arabinose transferase-like glycosyltransferase